MLNNYVTLWFVTWRIYPFYLSSRDLWQLNLQLPVQSVPITTNVVSLNPDHDDVYSIHHYVIKFISDRSVVFSGYNVLRFPPSIKLTFTILLKYC